MDIFNKLSGYKGISQLKKAGLNLLVRGTMERRSSDENDDGTHRETTQRIKDLRLQF